MDDQVFNIDYTKFVLDNGLEVILHEDHADPIIAVAILYHVGSNRERPGKTGFAHFFEHMLFQNSENVGKGNFIRMIEEAGGTMNGGTWQDGTIYYEVVPKNALERILWLESDRMGFMINTVTQDVLENEKEVVKNEKRQRVDNQPYGHTSDVIDKHLFPADHPYSWQIIGSMEDLNAATIDDVKAFYNEYYGPNNATMVIAGDIEPPEVERLVKKYFAEIPARGQLEAPKIQPIILDQTKKLYYEDNLASLPQLTMTFPTIEETHPDYYPLAFLGSILASGKRAPLYKIIVEDKQLAPRVIANNRSLELAGKFTIKTKAKADIPLDEILESIYAAFDRLLSEGIDERDIQKVKNAQEIEFYHGISNVLNKSFQLAQYNVFRGEPNKLAEEIKALMQVTEADILRVFKHYIVDKPCVITSFVPKQKLHLVVKGSVAAEVEREAVTPYAPPAVLQDITAELIKSPSHIDRSLAPGLSKDLEILQPDLWNIDSQNGINVLGTEDSRLPIIEFSIRWHGGLLRDQPDKIGVANALSDSLREGTRHKTPEALQDAIHQLGSNIQLYTSSEFIDIYVSSLTRNFLPTWALVREMLLEPRWDRKEFKRIKHKILSDIEQQRAKPDVMAGLLLKKTLYQDHILANFTLGSPESVRAMNLEDLQNYYAEHFRPQHLSMHMAGDLEQSEFIKAVEDLNSFHSEIVRSPDPVHPVLSPPTGNMLYIIDQPGASQSVINIGRLGTRGNHPDLNTLHFINYRLGGNFNSILNTRLREEKGYTYGVSSSWTRRKTQGLFIISTKVQTEVTGDALKILRSTLEELPDLFNDQAIQHTRQVILRSQARAYESLYQKINILEKIPTYDLPLDFIDQKINHYRSLSKDTIHQAIHQYLQRDQMIYIVVGDAQKLMPELKSLGFSEIIPTPAL